MKLARCVVVALFALLASLVVAPPGATAAPAATISGMVTTNAEGLGGVSADLAVERRTPSGWVQENRWTVRIDRPYSISVSTPGTYRLHVTAYSWGVSPAPTFTEVSVAEAEVRTGIDLHLAADPTISGTITAEDFDLNALDEDQPLVVEALAQEGGAWVVAGRAVKGALGRPDLVIRADGTYTLAVRRPFTQVRLKFHQPRCAIRPGAPCDGGGPDIPASDVQSTYWDGTTHGAFDAGAAALVDLSAGSVVDRNVKLTRSKKVRAAVRPKILGDPSPGQVLTASPGTFTPAATSVAYQWLLDSVENSGEHIGVVGTGRTLKVLPRYLGMTIALTVTPTALGFEAPILQTPSVVVKSRSRLAVKAKAGTRKATVTIAIRAPGVATPRIHGKASIYAKGQRIKTVNVKNGKATIKITKQAKGKRTYTVRYSGNRIITSSSTSLRIAIR